MRITIHTVALERIFHSRFPHIAIVTQFHICIVLCVFKSVVFFFALIAAVWQIAYRVETFDWTVFFNCFACFRI